MIHIPDKLAKCMVDINGDKGAQWVQEFPQLLNDCAKRWELQILEPYSKLSYNFVVPVLRADGTDAVLKLGVPGPEFSSEIAALLQYAGHGMARLFGADRQLGAILLERLTPGQTLATLQDEEHAASIAVEIMQQLFRPVPREHEFPSTAQLATGLTKLRTRFAGETGPLPKELVEKAESLFAALIGSTTDFVLLHGDLHHDNILAAERQPWLAIDPKGVIGDREFETVQYLINYLLDKPSPLQTLERRIDIFVEQAGFSRERIVGWGLAKSVLSAWWCIEGRDQGWEQGIRCAEMFEQLM